MEWISVKDRLPYDHAVCIVISDKGIGLARYTVEEGFHNNYTSGIDIYVYRDDLQFTTKQDDIKYWANINCIPSP